MPVELRVVSSSAGAQDVDSVKTFVGSRAVTVGESWKSRDVPRGLLGAAVHCVFCVLVTALHFFSPVTGSMPSKRALLPLTRKARIPAETFWTT